MWTDMNLTGGMLLLLVMQTLPGPTVSQVEHQVRLANYPSRCAGRVEIFYNNSWGTVCDDNWNLADAEVVCRQLGCGPAQVVIQEALFGAGSGPIWLDEVYCRGNESMLTDCKLPDFGDHNCDHYEDAGVVCIEPVPLPLPRSPLRLVSSDSRCSGRLELIAFDVWGTVCENAWGMEEAEVVCRQLGCGAALSVQGDAHFGEGIGPIWLDEVACVGNELSLLDCAFAGFAENYCYHDQDIGVICEEPESVSFTGPEVLDISACPFTFYGQTYHEIYVSFEEENLVICFAGFYNPLTSNDCIIGTRYNSDSGTLILHSSISDYLDYHIKSYTPAINNQGRCFYDLQIDTFTSYILHNYGTQGVFLFTGKIEDNHDHVVISILANGTTIQSKAMWTFEAENLHYFDVSGCRHSDVVYAPGSVVNLPEICFTGACDTAANFVFSECGPMERCLGNNICAFGATCTVTGSTVIGFDVQVNVVPDRCAYQLMSLASEPDFQVLANFRERRRRDVSFLDSVTVRLNGSDLHLGPYGTVQMGTTALLLDGPFQAVQNIELLKDQSGVMAKVPLADYTIYLFFDGDTTHIRLEGNDNTVPSLLGLCGNSTVHQSKISADSSSGCETQYSDPEDTTIDCNLMVERCNLLREAPFADCNIDPEPYITACTENLCKYPAVDSFSCDFLESYARVCSLYNNIIADSWRTTTGCSSSGGFCQDRVCTHNEFCAETEDGDPACFCRAIFAAPLRSSNMFGQLKACDQGGASLTLVGCLLEEKGIDYSDLHLNNETCQGHLDEDTHMVTFSFNSRSTCGVVVTANDSHVIYTNTIQMLNSSSDIVTPEVSMDFSCVHAQPDIKTVFFRIIDNSVVLNVTSGPWDYLLSMVVYSDADRTQVVDLSTDIEMDQKVWVELMADGLDGNLVAVVTDSCYATNESSTSASLRYELIDGGCGTSADQTVMVEGNGKGTSNYFSFKMFQFFGNSGDVYLHCRVELCIKENNNCVPTCNGGDRRRRSVDLDYEGEAVAFISMTWTN